MNAKRLKIGDQVVVKTVPTFAKSVVVKGDRARVSAVLKDGKKVHYKFLFAGYSNLGRRSRKNIQLPRKLFKLAEPVSAKAKPKREPRAPKPSRRTALQVLHECQGLMEQLIGALATLEKFSVASTQALPLTWKTAEG